MYIPFYFIFFPPNFYFYFSINLKLLYLCAAVTPEFPFTIFNPDTGDEPKPLVADSESTVEKFVFQNNDPPVDSQESNRSPKRPNDESITNPKKKVSVTVTVLPHFTILSLFT